MTQIVFSLFFQLQTKSWWYPVNRIKTAVFMSAAQVPDMEGYVYVSV